MDKYEIEAAINTIINKLYEVKVPVETTSEEMVREYWAVVNAFPIPLREL